MPYRYKRDGSGRITERKVRSAVRGDLMRPHQHFNPDRNAAHLSHKAAVRLLFSLAASMGLKMDQFDIATVFLHEKYACENPVFICQHPSFNGTFLHNTNGGQLIKNVYGTPPSVQVSCFGNGIHPITRI